MAKKCYIGCITFNNSDEFANLVANFKNFQRIEQIFELLVVDNSDNPAERTKINDICKQGNWSYTSKPNKGFGAGVNTLANSLDPKSTLVLCNADVTFLSEPPFEKMCQALRENKFNLVGTTIANITGQPCAGKLPPFGWGIVTYNFRSYSPDNTTNHQMNNAKIWNGAVHGACFAFEVEKFIAVGGIDEKLFLYAEEFDLEVKFHKNGLKIGYLPSNSLLHASEGVSNLGRNLLNLYNLKYLSFREKMPLLFIYFSAVMLRKLIRVRRFDLIPAALLINTDRKAFLRAANR
jgi:GT2 family glycosyltransferase